MVSIPAAPAEVASREQMPSPSVVEQLAEKDVEIAALRAKLAKPAVENPKKKVLKISMSTEADGVPVSSEEYWVQ